MTELVIDGWVCSVTEWGDAGEVRVARKARRDVAVYCPKDGSLHVPVGATPAVLRWLIRPLLHDEWEDGYSEGAGLRTKDNPHTDKDGK